MKYSLVTHTTCQYVYDDYCLGKNGKVCKRDLLIVHHHKHFTKLTYIAYYPVQWSVCRSPFQLPFCSVLYQRNFHFCTEKLCFAISISEQSSTNFLVNSARKTQCNKHTVQWTQSAMRSLRSPEFTATFSNLSSRQWRRMHDGEMKQILEIRISQGANSIIIIMWKRYKICDVACQGMLNDLVALNSVFDRPPPSWNSRAKGQQLF